MSPPSPSPSPKPRATRPEPAGGFGVAALAGSAFLVAALVVAAVALGRSVSPVTWYVARASGFALYLMLWISMLAGLGLTTGLLERWLDRGVVFSLHAFATQLAYGFLALHLLSLVADPTVRFGPRELLVPFASGVGEPWTGLGVLAGQLTVIIGASFAVRQRIGSKAWRALHWFTFPLYALSLLHGFGAGTDARQPWAELLYLATGAQVVGFILYRLFRRGARSPRPSAPPTGSRFAHAHPGDRR
jgi:methionine sulfoxide reductase heme-binding subunit